MEQTTFEPGAIITSGYIVQDVRGRGGFSQVYKVLNELTEEVLAIKVFTDSTLTNDLLHEYLLLKGLHHPQIAKVYDARRLPDGRPYILTEYAGDYDLRRHTSPATLLPLAEVHQIGCQALAALAYMHQDEARLQDLLENGTLSPAQYNEFRRLRNWGFYHRDIKPENIVLDRSSGELCIKLIDFNAAVQVGGDDPQLMTLNYLAPDFDPNLHQPPAMEASRDLFALGVVLYELVTSHHPYEREEGGRTQRLPTFDAPQSAAAWGRLLPPAWVAFLNRAVAQLASDRFASAAAMLTALEELPISFDLPADKQHPPADRINTNTAEDEARRAVLGSNYNPYVHRFQTMYSQARNNRGTRSGPAEQRSNLQRRDELGAATYVETLLDSSLRDDILGGNYRLIVISGNAGDGKTAFIHALEEAAFRNGAIALDQGNDGQGNGSHFGLSGYSFRTNYDGSQNEDAVPNREVLARFLSDFKGGDPRRPHLGLGEAEDGKVFIIAINEGRLRDFLAKERDTFPALYQLVARFFGGEDVTLPDDMLFINLNSRSLLAGGESILERQLVRLLDQSFWQPCEGCSLKDRCYIKFNADSLRDPAAGPAVRGRLHSLLTTAHLRRTLHITMRDLRSLLAYTLTADSNCEQVAGELAALDAGSLPLDYAASFYYNLNAGERGSGDRLVAALQAIDVATVANPLDDRSLYFDGRLQDAGLEFAARSDVDRRLLDGVREQPAVDRLRLHAQLRRKAFFERRDADWEPMLPYQHLTRFRHALADDDADELDDLKLKLLRGLSLSLGEDNAGLILPDDAALYLRAVNSRNRPTIFSYRRFAAADFSLRPHTLDQRQAHYIEYEPDRLVLEHRSRAADEPDARLELTLDLFENLLQLEQGYIPSRNQAQGSLINLAIFKNTLARLPYRELLLLDGQHRYVVREADGKLTLSRAEEE